MNEIHGGNIYSYENEILDFSANINPLGMPKYVKDAIIDAIDGCANYPDPFCRDLKKAISSHEKVEPSNIFCGNGAAEIIYRIVLTKRPKTSLILAPTFAEYEQALLFSGSKVAYHYLDKDTFKLDETILHKIKDAEIIFVCNPNNPTGILTEPDLIKKIIETASKHNNLVVVDECFISFVENGEHYSCKNLLNKYDNLLILKAFTKIYAMAGVRLGYSLMNNQKFVEKMDIAGSTWNVSHLAQKAGVAALSNQCFLDETLHIVKNERKILKEALENLGLYVFDGKANYLFFKSENIDLKEKLLQYHILIRDCCNYIGLESGYYRVCVRKNEENIRLVESLRNILRDVEY